MPDRGLWRGSHIVADEIGPACRSITGGASAGTARTYTTANQQHTALESIDATTRRYYDPYGNQPGWPDNMASINQPQDPSPPLGLLGARQYEPATGRFLSLDPVFEAGQPTQMGGYTSAANNPATNADPTGLHGVPSPGTQCNKYTPISGQDGHDQEDSNVLV